MGDENQPGEIVKVAWDGGLDAKHPNQVEPDGASNPLTGEHLLRHCLRETKQASLVEEGGKRKRVYLSKVLKAS